MVTKFGGWAIAVVVAAVSTAGCVSTKTVPLDRSGLAAHSGQSLAVTKREKPSFVATTAGKAMFGMVGAAAMISAGNDIVRKNAIDDPASYLAAELASRLASAGQLTPVDRSSALANTTEVAKLAKLYPDVDLLLDVQTIGWSFAYFPTDWNSYRVMYSVKVRLIEARKGKLLAETFCSRMSAQGAEAPSYDQLLAQDASLLKSTLRAHAEQCLVEIQSKLAV